MTRIECPFRITRDRKWEFQTPKKGMGCPKILRQGWGAGWARHILLDALHPPLQGMWGVRGTSSPQVPEQQVIVHLGGGGKASLEGSGQCFIPIKPCPPPRHGSADDRREERRFGDGRAPQRGPIGLVPLGGAVHRAHVGLGWGQNLAHRPSRKGGSYLLGQDKWSLVGGDNVAKDCRGGGSQLLGWNPPPNSL